MMSGSTTTSTRAIVASKPDAEHTPGKNWKLQDITVPTQLQPGEVLVEIVATGICHTDLSMTGPVPHQTFPLVAGHEGSGYVRAVGPNVKKNLAPGDPVLLSFTSCTACPNCQSTRPAYCDVIVPINIFPGKPVFSTADSADPSIVGKYFGQSSFANFSIVSQESIVPAKDLVQNDDDLKLFAPLGCGIQTGAGAILNTVKAGPNDRVMVCGLGGVGLSAVMAAKIAGCKQIIAVDRLADRIEAAKTIFGATDGLDTTDLAADAHLPAMKKIAGGRGPTIVIETTGFPPIMDAAYLSVDTKGTYVQIGGPPQGHTFNNVDVVQHMFRGVNLIGCSFGDSYPPVFVPQLIKYYREGKLPIDKIVKYYPAAEFETALHDMHTGKTIKPILLW